METILVSINIWKPMYSYSYPDLETTFAKSVLRNVPREPLYPTIGIGWRTNSMRVRTNFGQRPFEIDLGKRSNIWRQAIPKNQRFQAGFNNPSSIDYGRLPAWHRSRNIERLDYLDARVRAMDLMSTLRALYSSQIWLLDVVITWRTPGRCKGQFLNHEAEQQHKGLWSPSRSGSKKAVSWGVDRRGDAFSFFNNRAINRLKQSYPR